MTTDDLLHQVSSKHEMSTLCAILSATDETRRPLMASDDH